MWKKKTSRALMYQLMLIGNSKAQAGGAWKHVLQNSHHVLALILYSFLSIRYQILPEKVIGAD